MPKIYIVTTGAYSDYGIDAPFSSKERAEQYVAMITDSYETSRVEEFEVDPEKVILDRGYGYWRVLMNREGEATLAIVSQKRPDGFNPELAKVFKAKHYDKVYLKCTMVARDEKIAVKIANERRTAILAAHQWPENPPEEE